MVEALFLVILSASSRLKYDRASGLLQRQSKNAPDASVLAAGIMTFLHQLPAHYLMVRLPGAHDLSIASIP